jgi:hypothetical protein
MSYQQPPGGPSEAEYRAQLEEQLKRLRVEDVLLESVVSMINLAARRAGLADGAEDERDLDQVRVAIEALRALGPVLDQVAPQQAPALRDALAQLQMAYVRAGGRPAEPGAPPPEPPAGGPGGPDPAAGAGDPAGAPRPGRDEPGPGGPAQRSGRLWIPGQ